MFEILLQSNIKADMKRAGSYEWFIKALKDIEERGTSRRAGDPAEPRLKEGHRIRPPPASACDWHGEAGRG
jgi:hypothetical protein